MVEPLARMPWDVVPVVLIMPALVMLLLPSVMRMPLVVTVFLASGCSLADYGRPSASLQATGLASADIA